MPTFVCVTCGTAFSEAESPPDGCQICLDERQYVPEEGQRWTTLDELRESHRNEVRDEEDLTGVGVEPYLAIGQRALLVPMAVTNLLWDCVHLLDDVAAAEIERRGGLAGVAISHPHYYTGMVEWAHRFDCPIYIHADDAEWILRPDPAIELWEGKTRELGDGLTLICGGGHFAGGAMLHWASGAGGAGALLSGDIVQVIPDRNHVGFMYSYPNLIPLPVAAVQHIAAALEPFPFDHIYGAWWGRLVRRDGKGIVKRSAERYARAIRGELPS
jgi:hypothetical protein